MCDCKHCVLYLAHLQYNSSSFNSECSVVTQFLIFTHYSRYVCRSVCNQRRDVWQILSPVVMGQHGAPTVSSVSTDCLQVVWQWPVMLRCPHGQYPLRPLVTSTPVSCLLGTSFVLRHSPPPLHLPHIPLLCLLLSWVNGVARCRCSPLLHCCSNTDKTYQPWSVSSIPSPGKQSSIRSIIRIYPWLIVTILHIFTNLSCSHSHSVRDRTRGTKAEWKTAFIHTESEQWSARAPRPHPASTRTEFCCHCVTPSLTTSEKQFWSFITFQYWLTQSSDTDHLTHNQG